MGSESDDDMIPEDLWSIKRFSEIGANTTGYPAISIWHDFKYHPKDVISGTQDWVYEHLGALFWVVEIWAPNKGSRDHRLQVDRLVPRAPRRRRPQAHQGGATSTAAATPTSTGSRSCTRSSAPSRSAAGTR
jgi:hypothetical protein